MLLQISKRISKTLESTRFNGALIVPVAAAKPSEVTVCKENRVIVWCVSIL